ncbi:type IV pilus modification PilV family protein [Persephonella sp.]
MAGERGFTLLEVLVALVILSVSVTVILNIQSNQIGRIHQQYNRLDALLYYKKVLAGLPAGDRYTIKTTKKDLPYGIKEVENKITDRKTGEVHLIYRTYEK